MGGGTLLLAAYLGLFVGLFAAVLGFLVTHWGRCALVATPFLWTGTEYLLSLGELGFPWLLLGHSQSVSPTLIQYAALTGVYGVSFWVVSVYLLVAAALASEHRRIAALALAAALALPYAYGRRVMDAAPGYDSTVRVAVVQPNMGRQEKWGAGGLERSFATLETPVSYTHLRAQET